jgi:NAD(P)-dependent dehydrogenase (short-subunit alcohol dehydrogenase family)
LGRLNAEGSYKRGERYNASKLGNALFLYELDRRLRAAGSSVKAVGCHPGIAMTDLTRHIFGDSVLKVLLGPIFNTPAMGAWPALQASTGEAASGDYYGPQGLKDMRGPSGPARRAAQATDRALARRLWDVSIEMTGVDPRLAPVS